MGMGAGFYLLPYGLASSSSASAREGVGPPVTAHEFFSAEERQTLATYCDDVFPKASSFGAVVFIETLLTAFETDPPKIFAGGPFSGRSPSSKDLPPAQVPENSFTKFLPLNRVQEAAWRLRIYGSKSIPGGYWNEKAAGPVLGLRELIKTGIQDARSDGGQPLDWGKTSSLFQKTVRTLVVEACFSAPEYGGNQRLEGWKLANFSGDSQPVGYSSFDITTQTYKEKPDSPVSAFDDQDPRKMGWVSKLFCTVITRFRGGRIYR
jgi:hypothetical protein